MLSITHQAMFWESEMLVTSIYYQLLGRLKLRCQSLRENREQMSKLTLRNQKTWLSELQEKRISETTEM